MYNVHLYGALGSAVWKVVLMAMISVYQKHKSNNFREKITCESWYHLSDTSDANDSVG